jgi:hypothetical protein
MSVRALPKRRATVGWRLFDFANFIAMLSLLPFFVAGLLIMLRINEERAMQAAAG